MSDTTAPTDETLDDILQEEGKSAPVTHAFDLPEDAAREARAALVGEEEAPAAKIETPITPLWRDDGLASGDILSWLFKSSGLGDVDVTEHEKDAYWHSFVHDTELRMSIPLDGRTVITVEVRGQTLRDSELIEKATKTTMGEDTSPAKTFQLMQQYAMILQLVSVGGIPVDFIDTGKVEGPVTPMEVTAIEARRRQTIEKMSPVRLALLCKAIMIYEIKVKLCNDAIANRKDTKVGFFKAPDTV